MKFLISLLQVAICFRTPRYPDESLSQPVSVQLQLRRPSDGFTSDPRPFQILPREVDPDGLTRKRQKISEENCLDRFLRENNLPTLSQATTSIANAMNVNVNQIQPHLQAKRDVIHVPRFTASNIKVSED
jgi:Rel homology dimerisation domain